MTDKELRKLSRLELLEMLLDVSKENENLKDKIAKLNKENEAAKSIENLTVTTNQVNDILRYANKLTESLKGTPQTIDEEKKIEVMPTKTVSRNCDNSADRNLYVRIMNYYLKNNSALESLPADMKEDIRNRIEEILKKSEK